MIVQRIESALPFGDGALRGPIAAAAISAILLRLANVALGIATTIILGRWLGASGFGVFAVGFATSVLIAGILQLALDHHIVNKSARYVAKKNWSLLNGVALYVLIVLALMTALLTVLFLGGSVYRTAGDVSSAFFLGVAVSPILIAERAASALIRGVGEARIAYVSQFLIFPSAHLILVAALAFTGVLTAQTALYSFAAASALSTVCSLIILARCWPRAAWVVRPKLLTSEWGRSTGYIVLGGLSGILFGRIETLALAQFSSMAEVGVFALAFRFAQFATFPIFALGSGLAPEISRSISSGDFERGGAKLVKATRICTALSVAASAVLFIACSSLFPAINPEFLTAAPVLLILTLGYVAQAASGFPMPLVVEFNLERKAVLPGVAVAALGVSLMLPLATAYGAIGAAIGTSIAVAATAIARGLVVYRNANVRCDVFAKRIVNEAEGVFGNE